MTARFFKHNDQFVESGECLAIRLVRWVGLVIQGIGKLSKGPPILWMDSLLSWRKIIQKKACAEEEQKSVYGSFFHAGRTSIYEIYGLPLKSLPAYYKNAGWPWLRGFGSKAIGCSVAVD
jgi:hypothetical protein